MFKCGYRIQRANLGIDDPIHAWEVDPVFNDIFKHVHENTIVDKTRCFILYQLVKQVSSLAGDIAEIGVYKGGTAKLLAQSLSSTSKNIYLFDTFTGMPDTDSEKDTYKKGDFGDTSYNNVKNYLKDCTNVNIFKGLFPQSVPNELYDNKFCMVHIDVDIYQSITDCCEFFYPRLEKSGVMIFDDYGFPRCPGAKMAVDQFFFKKSETPVYLPTGQCVVIKL